MISLTKKEFACITNYLLQHYGIDMSKKQFLIESKLSVEFLKRDIPTFAAFWQQLEQDQTGELKQMLIDLLTTNYTYFYREEAHFEYLRQQILPELRDEKIPVYRVWCAGCSKGDEVYTLAMQLMDCQRRGILTGDFQVMGTDISSRAIEMAQKGIYPIADYVRLPKEWQSQYCMVVNNTQFEIKKCIRDHVQFQKDNLMEKRSLQEKYHLIFCRNVMIYFNEATRKLLLQNLVSTLHPGGYLFIGHAETLQPMENGLEYIKPAIYKKIKET